LAAKLKEKFPGEFALRERMATDFPFYAETNLKIATKDGKIEPFRLNRAQRYIHDRFEKQLKETGRVRALVVKARQQGCSTYTAGRYYWRITMSRAKNAFILSHAQDTTKKLFGITHRYHKHCDPMFKVRTDAASTTELKFSGIDSTYTVGTAGAKDVGRGSTIQYFHGSEVAYWAYADIHFMGVMQSIPTGDLGVGTEIVLESTANGMNGKFYDMCMEALEGKSEYQVIFTPWFWQEEYTQQPPVDWEVATDDEEYKERYELSDAQMYWRHLKTRELGSEWRFRQEYPATIHEAFQTSGEESFIPPKLVAEIRIPKPDLLDLDQPAIGACDPAWTGDRTGIGFRIGKRVHDIQYHHGKDPTEVAQMCVDYINKYKLDRMFVDVIGIGAGVYSTLKHWGYGHIARPVNFSGSAKDVDPLGNPKYLNVRAQCWGRMKEDMEEGEYEIPNLDELATDLMAPGYHHNNPKGALQLESKKDMKARGVKSPDGGDVIAMTYAEPVHKNLKNRGEYVKVVSEYDALNF
jgi:hypothetical protein